MRQADVPGGSRRIDNATDTAAAGVHAILWATGIVHNFTIMQISACISVHIRGIMDDSSGTAQDLGLREENNGTNESSDAKGCMKL